MPIAPNGVRQDNAPAFAPDPPPLTRAELVEVYEIWKLLGPMAAARAATTATREQVLEAVALVALMRTEPVGSRWADYNMAFHGLIEDFGSGPRLGAILTELRGLASSFVRESILASADQRLDEANSEHEEILRAVIAGDAEAAADAALRHLDSSLRGLLAVREVRPVLSRTSPGIPPPPELRGFGRGRRGWRPEPRELRASVFREAKRACERSFERSGEPWRVPVVSWDPPGGA